LDKYADTKSIRLRKKLRALLPKYRHILMYVQTKPSQEFLEKESKRLSNRIDKIMELYSLPDNHEDWTLKALNEHKSSFEKKWEVPAVKTQLDTINFILN